MSEGEAAAPAITPLPQAAAKDQGEGVYRLRSHKVQASSLDEAWRLLDDAGQEEQEQHAQAKRLKGATRVQPLVLFMVMPSGALAFFRS